MISTDLYLVGLLIIYNIYIGYIQEDAQEQVVQQQLLFPHLAWPHV